MILALHTQYKRQTIKLYKAHNTYNALLFTKVNKIFYNVYNSSQKLIITKQNVLLYLFLQNFILAFAISQKINYNFKHTTIFHILFQIKII